MKPLVIFGAGGLGRELLGWIASSSETTRRNWQVSAFVDDDPSVGPSLGGLPVRRRSDFSEPQRYLLAIGSPAVRQRLASELAALGWQAESWLHESVLVGADVEIGEGTLVMPLGLIASGAKIGRFVLSIGQNGIGHDSRIGDFSVLFSQVAIGGEVTIGEGAMIGSGAVIHPTKRIGNAAIVGIGSVVIRDVPDGTTVFGNPARRMPQTKQRPEPRASGR